MQGDDTATSLAKVLIKFSPFLVLWKLVEIVTEWKTTVIDHLHDT
jgi:hypothetical protein